MRSIQSRLGVGLLLSLFLAFSALWLLVSINARFLAHDYIADRLEHDAETLLSAVDFDTQGRLVIDDSRIHLIYKQPFSGHYYVIATDRQQLGSRSLWDHSLQLPAVETGERSQSLQRGPEGQELLVLSAGYRKQGQALSISVAEDLGPINTNIDRFRYWFAAISAGMLLALVLLHIYILRKSLAPVRRMHEELKLLQQGGIERLSTDSPAELRPLTEEINHLLAIMEKRLRRSRDALGDLAHAIKKPLTVIRQLSDSDTLPAETKQVLGKQVDAIYGLSDRILKRARLSGHGHGGSQFIFSRDLPALVKTLDMMHAHSRPGLSMKVPEEVPCAVEREDMMELLGNLLDNAYKWAEGRVMLSVSVDSALRIRIEDDGPGIEPEKIQQLSKRGVRLDEAVQGHGFGLAIAADIVGDYGGTIRFGRSSRLGGFMVEIQLPLVPSSV